MFLTIDGIDGSGKGVITDTLLSLLTAQGKKIVDLRTFMRESHSYATEDDFKDADVVVTTEPGYAWIGAAIREELAKNPAYAPETVAAAFSIDREIHYRRVVLPALAAGKTVISERGVSSSLAYQFTAGVAEEVLLALPGNALALKHAPDFLILASLPVDEAVRRLASRAGKSDDSYFEKKSFLVKLAERYASDAFRNLFTERGTKIVDLATTGTIEETKRRVETELLPLVAHS